jgi:hypothetical protein
MLLITIIICLTIIISIYLFTKCKHSYEVIDKYRVWGEPKGDITQYIQYVNRCSKCGKIKIVNAE